MWKYKHSRARAGSSINLQSGVISDPAFVLGAVNIRSLDGSEKLFSAGIRERRARKFFSLNRKINSLVKRLH